MSSKATLLKVVLLGDGGVGKSCLMNRYVNNKFDSQSFHTIGVEFLNKDVSVNGEVYTLQIWDTAGQERFKSLRTPFYRGADVCILVYSVDDKQSLVNLSMWKKEFTYYADVKEKDNFPFIVLGNKVDLVNRVVTLDEAETWCKENGGYPYYETSAKDSINVEMAFKSSVQTYIAMEKKLDKQGKSNFSSSKGVNLSNVQKNKSSSCCE